MSSSSDQDAIIRAYRVNHTVHEMMRARGYIISDEEIQMTLDDFKSQYAPQGILDQSRLNFAAHHQNGDPIYVYFSEEPRVGVTTIRKLLTALEEKHIPQAVLIFKAAMTPHANGVIAATQSNFHIETFQESELFVNITKHILVPKHEVLSAEDKKILLAKYHLKDTQLPRIQLSDPIARFYGMRRGQVVMITRKSETAGRYVSYRLAI